MMALYRWKKSTVVWAEHSYNTYSITFNYGERGYEEDRGGWYYSSNKPTIGSNGMYTQEDHNNGVAMDGGYYLSCDRITPIIITGSQGDSTLINVDQGDDRADYKTFEGRLGHSSTRSQLIIYESVEAAGEFVEYVYSTDSSAYPNGGVSGGYYYSDMLEIVSPVFEDMPQLAMQGNQITVFWSASDGADSYILERKADMDSDWVQVYSGANTSFEETVGAWTSVQYRVKAGVSGTYGDYTTSAEIPVVSASAVVISGSDGDLGTLTNDVIYTVSSDGTNPLTVVETINGMERTFTATNGVANRIHIFDLPTGSGTITIKATVTASGALVSATRNWTYTKTPMTFSDGGGMATLSQEGKTIFPKTLAEAVRMPGGVTLDRFIAATVITLTAAAWTQSGGVYTQTVDCPIVWPYAPIVIVEPDLTTEDQSADDAVLAAWQSGPGAKGMKQGDGEITFYSASQPTMNIPVRVGVI